VLLGGIGGCGGAGAVAADQGAWLLFVGGTGGCGSVTMASIAWLVLLGASLMLFMLKCDHMAAGYDLGQEERER
jgi:hypothetical protein